MGRSQRYRWGAWGRIEELVIVVGKCIYCSQTTVLSREHYLPRCLGNFRNYETLDDRVCGRCNNGFKLSEEQFCRSGPEALFREKLAIKGRSSHKKVSPFLRGSAGTEPLVMKGKFPGEDFEILWQLNRGSKSIDYITQIVFFTDSGTSHILPISDDMRDPSQLREKYKELAKRLGVERFKEARVIAPESATEWIEHLLTGLTVDSRMPLERCPERGKIDTSTIVTVTSNYFRALVKIGFHYFLTQMRGLSGSEATFADVRSFIQEGAISDAERFVSFTSRQISSEIGKGYRPQNWGHLLATGVNYYWLLAKLQFFLGPEYLAPVYLINLGKNPSTVLYREAHSHAFIYYENGPEQGYDGYVSEGVF